jgi:hypothetical protein
MALTFSGIATRVGVTTFFVFSAQKRYFITAGHSFAVKSPLFCGIFTSDLQQTSNIQATIMKFWLENEQ